MKPKTALVFVMVLAAAFATSSCSKGVSQIQTSPLPSPNPASFTFPWPVTEVHEKAWQAFSMDPQSAHPIFGRSSNVYSKTNVFMESILTAECATNAVFSQDLFRDPANTNDIYLHTF